MAANYSLFDLTRYFLRLGTVGFGGPVALVGYMHRDLVAERQWISEDDYREGMALAQLSPGPLAAQLGIYLGYVHYGVLGATLTGLAFVLPSFFMVLAIGVAYGLYGGLPWMQAIFYGVGASVIGIIGVSAWKLTLKSVGSFAPDTMRQNWLLWLLYLTAGVYTVIFQREEVWMFVAAGLVYMLVKAPPRWISPGKAPLVLLFFGGIMWSGETGELKQIAWFFTEAGAFVFGSGLAIIPFLHSGVVAEFGWLNEKEFLDAVAVAMITPGPVVITVAFIGYLVAGVAGACVAALTTFLPCYLLTVIPAPYFKKHAKDVSIKAFVDGITAAVIGALTGAVAVIASRSITDITTAAIAICTALILMYFKKIPEYYIVLASAAAGFFIQSFLT
jgi:chromate transporter